MAGHMTFEEHALLITMFAKQAQQIRILETILKAKGILEGDDTTAFAAAAWADDPATDAVADNVADKYRAVCNALGIKVDGTVVPISDWASTGKRRAT
jgi:hypothetical protein